MFKDKDILQIESKGISVDEVNAQVKIKRWYVFFSFGSGSHYWQRY